MKCHILKDNQNRQAIIKMAASVKLFTGKKLHMIIKNRVLHVNSKKF